MPSISAIVITLNEEKRIQACLDSISWVDEIIVVDSGSTDRTRQIANGMVTRLVESEWLGFAETKALAVKHTTGDWILWVDADEIVPDSLSAEIRSRVGQDGNIMGFMVPRKAIFLGKWIRHCGWYPGYVCRLFKREHGEFTGRLVHESVTIDGRTDRLKNHLIHYTDDSLEHYLHKFNKYTTLGARQLQQDGNAFHLKDLILRPPFMFVKMYLLKLGILDGIQGFILCFLSSCYVFTKYAKLWHLQQGQPE